MKCPINSLAIACGCLLISQSAMGFFCFSFGSSNNNAQNSSPRYTAPQPYAVIPTPRYRYAYQPRPIPQYQQVAVGHPPAYQPYYPQPRVQFQPMPTHPASQAIYQPQVTMPQIQNGIIQLADPMPTAGFID
ncbi:MAG: hypothetical protein HOM11_05675 [Methylococcales bacterium]|jgi:hypothetical protein|nr:hypothetical protein [Methylococcales bacterium]MBT7444218.1 hypothetical protein [Methylococcales bacterium]